MFMSLSWRIHSICCGTYPLDLLHFGGIKMENKIYHAETVLNSNVNPGNVLAGNMSLLFSVMCKTKWLNWRNAIGWFDGA
jgi:hypothetical protein